MDVSTAICQRRSIRRFKPQEIASEVLEKLVLLGRLYASGANLQPIRFGIVSQRPQTEQLFSQLSWAAYLPEYEVPAAQQPAAYIVLLRDNSIKHNCQFEVGAAATTIVLAAKEQGLDSCCLGSFQAAELKQMMNLSEQYEPELVIALGYAEEKSVAVDFSGSVRYYQTDCGELRVPKLSSYAVTVYSDLPYL